MKFSKTLMMTAAAAILSTGAMAQSVTTNNTTGINTPAGNVGVDTSTTMSPSTENATEADINASSESSTSTEASVDRVANLDSGTIEEIQNNLKEEGHTVSVDGVWGPNTAAAIRAFQQSKDLPVTGQIDTQTLAALDIKR